VLQRPQGKRHLRVPPFRHQSLRLFVASLVCVLLHFLIDFTATPLLHSAPPGWADGAHILSIWMVALAAVLPVLGLGLRAWTGAFEYVRSSAPFTAKNRALTEIAQEVDDDRADLVRTCQHINSVENFLEEEHREWLRLLCEAEWFL
jgi:hypothetical protein